MATVNGRARPVRLRIEPLEARETPAAFAATDFDPDRVLVAFNSLTTEAAATATLTASPLAEGISQLGLGVYSVDLRAGVSVTTAMTVFSALPNVAAAQPDYVLASTALPNDPSVSTQYQYQAGTGGIDATTAWNAARGTGRTVVAVIDSGVDTTHPDLAANLWRNSREVAGNGRDDDGNGFVDDVFGANFVANNGNVYDDYGHGTHVAGIVGAVGNNGVGVSGVAWTTKLMALKFMDSSGVGYTSNAIRAIDYAVANGARVISASWGGSPYDSALAAALSRAQSAGVIFVAAAGNQSANIDSAPYYPAGYIRGLANVVTVAATDSSDNLASYSSYGASTVTLAAPGSNITSTLPGGRYGTKSGTSMAAPMVAGAIAVLWDQNPTWSYQQIIAKLKASVDVLPALAGKTQTGGRLDLAKMVGATSPPVSVPPVPVSPPPAPMGGPKVVSAAFGGSKAGTFDRITVTFDRAVDPLTFAASDVAVTGPGGTIKVSAVVAVGGSGGTSFTLMLSAAQTRAGSYSAVIGPDIRDTSGRVGEAYTLTGTLGTVTPPPVSPPPVSPPPATTTAAGPKVVTAVFGGPRAGVFDRVTVTFDRAIDVSSFTPSDVTVKGPGGTVKVSAIVPVAGSGNKKFYVVFSKDQSSSGAYSSVVGPDILDTAGNRMDQNGNGVGGQTADYYMSAGTLGATAKANGISRAFETVVATKRGAARGFVDAVEMGVWVGGSGKGL